ncbi:odorant receptor Or2 [Lasioglossum baleicum]|uniref:odorant receptor Or2 n=1 Tax=Lasioglossum baleicum TaxID=434251 RepID=UPI003FCE5771
MFTSKSAEYARQTGAVCIALLSIHISQSSRSQLYLLFLPSDYDWAVGINRICLRLVCLWPRESHGKGKLLENLCVMTIVLILCGFVVIPGVLLLLKQNELKSTIDDSVYSLTVLTLIPKILIIHGKRSVMLKILNVMADDWEKPKTDEEKNIMYRYAKMARIVAVLGFIIAGIAILMIIVLPKFGIYIRHTTDGIDVFPFPTYYVYDVTRSPYYEIIYFGQIFMLVITLLAYNGINVLFGTIFLHICGQAKNLRSRIASQRKFGDFSQALASIVSDHVRLIRTVKMIESTFSVIMLTMLLMFAAITCSVMTSIFSIFAEKDGFSLTRVLYLVLLITTNFIQMFFYFITGQTLLDESEGIYDATYECGWLNLKSNEARSLILVMARSKQPLFVSAGKLFPMSYLTFGSVIKISFSYMSFLVTML